MTKNNAIIILYLVGAIIIEEAHQLFSKFVKVKINPFPFDDSKISVQWYVYDLSNCVSAVLIALAVYTAFATRNMKDFALVYLGYRVIELILFVLWDKRSLYSIVLAFSAFVFFLIIQRWKKV